MNFRGYHFPKMSFTFILTLGLFFSACQNTESSSQANTTTTDQAIPVTPQTVKESTPSSSTPQAAENTKPLTGTRAAYVPPKAEQNPLTLGISNERVKSGTEVCVKVQVADFTALMSMQYSVKWDPKMLQFKKLDGFKLAGLGPEDFGAHRVAEGLLTSVWIDANLQGISLKDGADVYQICFQAIGAAGQKTEVNFSDGPTPFEVVNSQTQIVGLKGVAGIVTIN